MLHSVQLSPSCAAALHWLPQRWVQQVICSHACYAVLEVPHGLLRVEILNKLVAGTSCCVWSLCLCSCFAGRSGCCVHPHHGSGWFPGAVLRETSRLQDAAAPFKLKVLGHPRLSAHPLSQMAVSQAEAAAQRGSNCFVDGGFWPWQWLTKV